MVKQYASWASVALGLIITLLSLVITALVTESLSIQGLSAWVIGTIIVWLASIVTTFAMGLLFRSSLQERRSN
jgi:heme exporter protein D